MNNTTEISDEIREFCDLCFNKNGFNRDDFDKLRDLADRIDRETVELPRAADDEVIHAGDTLYTTDGDITQAIRICIWMNAKRVECVSSNGRTIEFRPFELTYERPDSFERIADELQDWSETKRARLVANGLISFNGFPFEIWSIGNGRGIFVDFCESPFDEGESKTLAFPLDLSHGIGGMGSNELGHWAGDAMGGKAIRDLGYEPVEEDENGR